MSQAFWEITHSVDAGVSPAFAWRYWSNIANWNDPPAKFELEGPFVPGTRGVTRLPDQDSLRWFIREVTPPTSAAIEMPLDSATITFEWRFTPLPGGQTRITQRIALQGPNAVTYLPQVQSAFSANLPAGMNKLAAAMAQANSIREVALD